MEEECEKDRKGEGEFSGVILPSGKFCAAGRVIRIRGAVVSGRAICIRRAAAAGNAINAAAASPGDPVRNGFPTGDQGSEIAVQIVEP